MVKLINLFTSNEDTFYSTLRPLALFTKALGMFPVQNVLASDGHDLTYNWLSIVNLWGPILYYTAHVVFYFLETNEWWRFLISYVNIPRNLLISVTSLIEDRHLTKLITKLEEFDLNYKKISRNNLKSAWRTYHGVIWVFVSLASLVFCVGSEFYIGRSADSFASFILAVTNQVNVVPRMLYLNMFMFFCQSLVWRFQDVRTLWRETVEGIGTAQLRGHRERAGARLEDVRLLYYELAMTVKMLNTCYGLRLAAFFVILLIDTLEDLFIILYTDNTSAGFTILFIVYNAGVVGGIVAYFTGKLDDTANGIQDEFGGCRVTSLSFECRQQVKLFATCRSEVHVSAAGFCNVDRSVMVSMWVSICTYLIALVQFDPQIRQFMSRYEL